ncbi:MAG: glycosyltransferase [Aquincola tertiaricarbonis]|uniref:glycosyltransferase n=1 Tax=Aquincola TaxID=391952 RepID=UPI0006151B8B|nr:MULTISPECIES: glycosyltransferase [Aquincola]MCR5865814.1 glycosyltransferase [Aquincola sp. J276]
MKIVLFAHPEFMPSRSMPRFAALLHSELSARGHEVSLWRPAARLQARARGLGSAAAKWAGYFDQYLLFPRWVRRAVERQPADTLFVFCDQALGPWVPLVAHRPHVVHVHDLLALRSALGLMPENPVGLTGRVYQRFIRRGFRQAQHFISISHKTRVDLHAHAVAHAVTSAVVHNGMNHPYRRMAAASAATLLRQAGAVVDERGFLLHVSAGQFYKNVPGVIALYAEHARSAARPLPLVLVGHHRQPAVQSAIAALPASARVVRLHDIDNETMRACYSAASAFLFPSLEEGFGWPIVEALACGCPVITTDAPPMNEVGGSAAFYIPRLPAGAGLGAWAAAAAPVLERVLALQGPALDAWRDDAAAWCMRFEAARAIEGYLQVYSQVLKQAAA